MGQAGDKVKMEVNLAVEWHNTDLNGTTRLRKFRQRSALKDEIVSSGSHGFWHSGTGAPTTPRASPWNGSRANYSGVGFEARRKFASRVERWEQDFSDRARTWLNILERWKRRRQLRQATGRVLHVREEATAQRQGLQQPRC